MKALFAEFKAFLLQADLVTLAVAVVIGTAFGALIGAVVSDCITPLIGAIFGGRGRFGNLSFTIHGSVFRYGNFLDSVITFVTIAAAVFFVALKPYQVYAARRASGDDEIGALPPTAVEQLLTEIRDLLALRAKNPA